MTPLRPLALLVAAVLAAPAARAQDPIAEADRLDPGWRLADIQAKRERPPAEQNAALVVKAALARLPEGWMAGGVEPPSEALIHTVKLYDAVAVLAPTERLDDARAAALDAELAPLSSALEEARKLADRPAGFFEEFRPAKNYFETELRHVQDARRIARLLQLDAIRRAHRSDADGAIDSIRAMLGVSRAIGDEPALISQFVRVAYNGLAVATLHRVLAQSRPTEPALARLAADLAAEAGQPLALYAFRGERAGSFSIYESLIAGELNLQDLAAMADPESVNGIVAAARRPVPGGRPFLEYNRDLTLGYFNRFVAIARRPAPEQLTAIEAVEAEIRAASQDPNRRLPGALTYLLLPAVGVGGKSFLRNRAVLEVARTAVAAERFRLAEGRPPAGAEELVPRFLDAVPTDPYRGGPIGLVPDDGGLIIHASGPDGQAHGGRLHPRFLPQPGFDIGYRLIDPERRPPAPRR